MREKLEFNECKGSNFPGLVFSETDPGDRMFLPTFGWFHSLCYCHHTKWHSPVYLEEC